MRQDPDTLNLLPLYFSARPSARVLGIVFVLAAAISWVAAGYDLGELRAMAAIGEGASLGPAVALARAEAGRGVAVAQISCALFVAAAFCPWLYQVRANVRALGARRLRFGREWTYLGFAIPVLNAYRPYQVVSEVWRASDPASLDPLGWQRLPTSRLVLAWWVGLAGWVVCEALAALLLHIAPGIEHVETAHAVGLVGDVGSAVSASLGYFLVARISAAQDAKWAAFGRGDALSGAAPVACGSAVRA
ncbi:MAG TPA: DUF4328 domain-containing protein [Myxococcota bacterium]|nr:DUF4328 domain-containing protein [Myxococcota bacterium]